MSNEQLVPQDLLFKMSMNHSDRSLPTAPESANLPPKPDQPSIPPDIVQGDLSGSSEASKNLQMNAQGDVLIRRSNTPKMLLDIPRLSSTTKDILARVQNAGSRPVAEVPRNDLLRDKQSPASSSLSVIHSMTGKSTGIFSSTSTPASPPITFNPSVPNTSPFGNTGGSTEIRIPIDEPGREALDHPNKVITSTPSDPASQNPHNSKPEPPETTIHVASTVTSQGSMVPVPPSAQPTQSSSSRRQRQYVLPDGTITSGKGLGRGRPGIKRGPRKPKLDTGSSGSSMTNIAAASSGPGSKRKRLPVMENAERTKTSRSLSEDTDSDTYTPKATHTRSGRHTQRPSTLVLTDSPAPKKARLAGETSDGHGKSSVLIKKRVYKGKEQNALCELCSRGRSIADNAIVFCDGCNYCWHQDCHEPKISRDVVKDTTAQWFCNTCIAILGQKAKGQGRIDRQISESGGRALDVTSKVAPPIIPPPVLPRPTTDEAAVATASAALVGARSLSLNQRQNYLNSLSREQLLGLLLHASNMAPDLLIFPTPITLAATKVPSNRVPNPAPVLAPSFAPSVAITSQPGITIGPSINPTRTGASMQPPPPPPPPLASSSNPNLNPSRAAKAAAPKYTSPSSPSSESADESEPEDHYDEEEEDYGPSHAKCYPKPGQGLMVRLPPDKVDEHILLEGPESRTFSHSVREGGVIIFGIGELAAGDPGGLEDEDKENWDGRGR